MKNMTAGLTDCCVYKLSPYVYSEIIGTKMVYFNLKSGRYISIPLELNRLLWVDNILYQGNENSESYQILRMKKLLVSKGFIEPDLLKLKIGNEFFYFPEQKQTIYEKYAFSDIYISNNFTEIKRALYNRGYIDRRTRIHYLLEKEEDVEETDYISSVYVTSVDLLCKAIEMKKSKVIFVCSSTLNEIQIKEISSMSEKRSIYILIDYLNPYIDQIVNSIIDIQNDNLIITVDICIPFSKDDIDIDNNIDIPIGIKQEALTCVKLTCGAGVNKYYIDEAGYILPCYRMREAPALGNIYNSSPEDFLAARGNRKFIWSHDCKECAVKFFCGGGCKANYREGYYKGCDIVKTSMEREF